MNSKKIAATTAVAALMMALPSCALLQEEEECVELAPVESHAAGVANSELVVEARVVGQAVGREIFGSEANQWELGIVEVLEGDEFDEGDRLVIGSTPEKCAETPYPDGDAVAEIEDDDTALFYLTKTNFGVEGEQNWWALVSPGAILDIEDAEVDEDVDEEYLISDTREAV